MYIRRKQLTKTKFAILSVFCLCAAVSAILQVFEKETMGFFPVSATVGRYDTIIIDAGHGGSDGGTVGIHGELEKEINLSIAKDLQELLLLSGIQTVMVREGDYSIHDSSADTIAKQKVSDIHNRFQLMEKETNAIVVSIHQNHFTQSRYHGAQMFYGIQNPASKELATCLQDAFVENLQPENTRQIKQGTSSVYLLKNVTRPIVLAECGFLSNAEEAMLLKDRDYQRKVAFTVYQGIMEFLETTGTHPITTSDQTA